MKDKSHQRSDRKKRDKFVNGVFAAAHLPLTHIPVKQGCPTEKLKQYLQQKADVPVPMENRAGPPMPSAEEASGIASPLCLKYGAEMVKRTAKAEQMLATNFGHVQTTHAVGELLISQQVHNFKQLN